MNTLALVQASEYLLTTIPDGPKNEHVQMLEGDHRSICKPENELDSNYRTIRNHLARVVDQLLQLGEYLASTKYTEHVLTGNLRFWSPGT